MTLGIWTEGDWEGSLNAGGTVLRLRLKLANRPESGATGSLVSVDQGGLEFAITTIVQTAQQLKLELPAIGASYSGELKEGRLVGDWTQGGARFPSPSFARIPNAAARVRRPPPAWPRSRG